MTAMEISLRRITAPTILSVFWIKTRPGVERCQIAYVADREKTAATTKYNPEDG
jgi:hypothetical protein